MTAIYMSNRGFMPALTHLEEGWPGVHRECPSHNPSQLPTVSPTDKSWWYEKSPPDWLALGGKRRTWRSEVFPSRSFSHCMHLFWPWNCSSSEVELFAWCLRGLFDDSVKWQTLLLLLLLSLVSLRFCVPVSCGEPWGDTCFPEPLDLPPHGWDPEHHSVSLWPWPWLPGAYTAWRCGHLYPALICFFPLDWISLFFSFFLKIRHQIIKYLWLLLHSD